jgi:hypothetical protein
MRNKILRLGLWLLAGVLPLSMAAQKGERPELLIVGTYHMANRGHDAYNVQADDILSSRRQQEIEQVIEVLKRFRPTKIAIEDQDGQHVAQEYSDYLAGKYTLSRDETNQLGYRLAKELGHQQVYPVNAWVGNDFPIEHVINYAKGHGRAPQLETIMAKWGAAVKELDGFLQAHTGLETLEHANSDAFVAENVSPYFEVARFGDPLDYAGADLLGNYYLRNIRIYQNIVNLADSPSDRILVIYGYGHLGWLRQNARQDRTLQLRTLSEFMR